MLENFSENWKIVNIKNLAETGKCFGKFNKTRKEREREISKKS